MVSKVKNLRWNFEEFRINYHIDKQLIKVSQFYLNKLLSEGDAKNNYRPYLTMEVKTPILFELWDELQYKFMPSSNENE